MGSNSHGSIRERNEYNENTNDRHGTETIESNERNERNDEKKVNEEKEKPWKIVVQNMEGQVTEKSWEEEEDLFWCGQLPKSPPYFAFIS